MFNSISWQEFLSVTAIVVSAYYTVSGYLFYRQEIKSIFTQKQPKQITPAASGDQSNLKESISFLGDIKSESLTQSNVSREQISIAEEIETAEIKEIEESTDLTLISALNRFVSTLQTEIESLLEGFPREDKVETGTFFKTLLRNYPQLVETDHQEEISQHIYDELKKTCAFHLELNEVKSWWPLPAPTSDSNQ